MTIIYTSSITALAQKGQSESQTLISVDTRFGYSTNSYLNPFISEWNPFLESTYNITSLLAQQFWYVNGHSFSITGGAIFEPLFNKKYDNWKGGLGLIDYNYRISGDFSLGLDAGGSYMQGNYSRTLIWAQPKVTWFASPFTLVRLKAGPNFRNYANFGDTVDSSDRSDLYSVEIETWPSYKWRLSAGLYGSLDNLPSIQKGFNVRTTIDYYFKKGASLSLSGIMQQFQMSQTTNSGGGGGTFPPVGGDPNATSTITGTDRIFKIQLDGSLPLNKHFTLFGKAEGLKFNSESSNTSIRDIQVSGGVRFSIQPRFGSNKKRILPRWDHTNGEQELYIQYSGEGRLYLVGSFNNWNKAGIPLAEQSGNTYVAQLSLEVGMYEYKILKVQGDSEEWLPFSNDVYTVDDGFGSENAILLVKQNGN